MTNNNPSRLEEPTNYLNVKTFIRFRNRAERYRRRLLAEALTVAREKGLVIVVGDEFSNLRPLKGVYLQVEDRTVMDKDLLKLAKEKYPVLYRKYNQTLNKMRGLSDY